jgi:hypothetical protein
MFNPQGSIIQIIVFQKHIYVTNLQLLKYVTLFIFLCSSLEGGKPNQMTTIPTSQTNLDTWIMHFAKLSS